jgi:hypothetical protein
MFYTISLKNFLRTGNFGFVEMGMKKEEVIAILGKPFCENEINDGIALLYGWYEFYFWNENQQLFAIQNDSLQFKNCLHFENQHFKLDTWFLQAGKMPTLQRVKQILDNTHIKYTEEEQYELHILTLESGVTIDFEIEKGYVLNGIRYFVH